MHKRQHQHQLKNVSIADCKRAFCLPENQPCRAKVIDIIDGDTLRCAIVSPMDPNEFVSLTVRIHGVDTFESRVVKRRSWWAGTETDIVGFADLDSASQNVLTGGAAAFVGFATKIFTCWLFGCYQRNIKDIETLELLFGATTAAEADHLPERAKALLDVIGQCQRESVFDFSEASAGNGGGGIANVFSKAEIRKQLGNSRGCVWVVPKLADANALPPRTTLDNFGRTLCDIAPMRETSLFLENDHGAIFSPTEASDGSLPLPAIYVNFGMFDDQRFRKGRTPAPPTRDLRMWSCCGGGSGIRSAGGAGGRGGGRVGGRGITGTGSGGVPNILEPTRSMTLSELLLFHRAAQPFGKNRFPPSSKEKGVSAEAVVMQICDAFFGMRKCVLAFCCDYRKLHSVAEPSKAAAVIEWRKTSASSSTPPTTENAAPLVWSPSAEDLSSASPSKPVSESLAIELSRQIDEAMWFEKCYNEFAPSSAASSAHGIDTTTTTTGASSSQLPGGATAAGQVCSPSSSCIRTPK